MWAEKRKRSTVCCNMSKLHLSSHRFMIVLVPFLKVHGQDCTHHQPAGIQHSGASHAVSLGRREECRQGGGSFASRCRFSNGTRGSCGGSFAGTNCIGVADDPYHRQHRGGKGECADQRSKCGCVGRNRWQQIRILPSWRARSGFLQHCISIHPRHFRAIASGSQASR